MIAFLKSKLFKKIVYLLLLYFISSYFLKPLKQETIYAQTITSKKVIAVMDFKNNTFSSNLDYLGKEISESLSTLLIKHSKGKIIIVERAQIEKALSEMALQMKGLIDEETAVKVGKFSGATNIIIGSYSQMEDIIRINARVIDLQTCEGIIAESIDGKTGKEIYGKINRLSANIIEKLTGEKVKIKEYKSDEEFIKIPTKIKKKKFPWVVIGVIAVIVGIVIVSQPKQKTNVTVEQ